MGKGITFVIVLYAISQLMSSTFAAFERAASASFQALEVAAVVSQKQLKELESR